MSEKPRIRIKASVGDFKNTVEPAYHGASQSRRIVGYGTNGSGPNAVLSGSIETLRNRSRHADRNSPLIKKANNANVTNEVGTGFVTRFRSSNDEFNEAMRLAHDIWAKQCCPDGSLGFYGLQSLIARARRIAGDCFVRRRNRPTSVGLYIPMQVQVLEAEFVPHWLNETRRNGNKIKQGIEFNKYGERVAYWMHKEHPVDGEAYFDPFNLIRVSAKDVIHTYKPSRPGQIRGEPESSSSLLKVKTFEQYDDFELQRKEARAGYTGMLTRQEYDDRDYAYDPFTGKPLYEEDGTLELGMVPGTIMTGLPGEKLELFDGDNTGSGYKDYQREQKLMIAAGVDTPYELITGDWSGVNDRIYRAFINEYRRGIAATQDHLMVFQVLRVITDWFIQAAILSGRVKAPGYIKDKDDYHKAEHRPHAWKYVHPEQDVKAKILEIEAGLNSSDAIVAESGFDGEEIDRQNAIAKARRKELDEEYGLTNQTEESEEDPPQESDPSEEDELEEPEPA